MKTGTALSRQPIAVTVVATALSLLATTVLLVSVAELFVRDGLPLQHLLIAQRACSAYVYVSERDACVQEFLAAPYHHRVASR